MLMAFIHSMCVHIYVEEVEKIRVCIYIKMRKIFLRKSPGSRETIWGYNGRSHSSSVHVDKSGRWRKYNMTFSDFQNLPRLQSPSAFPLPFTSCHFHPSPTQPFLKFLLHLSLFRKFRFYMSCNTRKIFLVFSLVVTRWYFHLGSVRWSLKYWEILWKKGLAFLLFLWTLRSGMNEREKW